MPELRPSIPGGALHTVMAHVKVEALAALFTSLNSPGALRHWAQTYDPTGHPWGAVLFAGLSLLLLLGLPVILRCKDPIRRNAARQLEKPLQPILLGLPYSSMSFQLSGPLSTAVMTISRISSRSRK